ncbi:MAG: class I SAM-dependent methyltransferase [Pseudomonadota bacterium]
MTKLIKTWSSCPEDEDSMTKEHAWIWQAMIGAVPIGLKDRVLDIGCNQGGFLRMLHDNVSFAEGVGVDLATQRVALAEAHKGDRTLRYLATDQLSDAGTGFDVAFSHEVIYLIGDLADHARQVFEILRPGGAYYAVTCCHRDNPLWATWRPGIEVVSNVPVPDHSVGDIATAFRDAGFDVAINRFLADTFIPTAPPSEYFPSDLERLDVYTNWKLMFRMTRPA